MNVVKPIRKECTFLPGRPLLVNNVLPQPPGRAISEPAGIFTKNNSQPDLTIRCRAFLTGHSTLGHLFLEVMVAYSQKGAMIRLTRNYTPECFSSDRFARYSVRMVRKLRAKSGSLASFRNR